MAAADQDAPATVALATQAVSLAPVLQIKTVPRLRVYTGQRSTPVAGLTATALDLVGELLRTSRRERLEWTGPLHIVVDGDLSDPASSLSVRVAAPIRRVSPGRGIFSAGALDVFRCAWQRYEGPQEGLEQAWRDLYEQTRAAGLHPTAEARQVVLHHGGDQAPSVVELQIGIGSTGAR